VACNGRSSEPEGKCREEATVYLNGKARLLGDRRRSEGSGHVAPPGDGAPPRSGPARSRRGRLRHFQWADGNGC
jgi:hypothetical protein